MIFSIVRVSWFRRFDEMRSVPAFTWSKEEKKNSNRMQAIDELQRQITFYATDEKFDILNI